MMYYRISKNEKILFFGKKIAQVWAVTLNPIGEQRIGNELVTRVYGTNTRAVVQTQLVMSHWFTTNLHVSSDFGDTPYSHDSRRLYLTGTLLSGDHLPVNHCVYSFK